MKTGTTVKENVRTAVKPAPAHSVAMKGNGLTKAKKVKMVRGSLAMPQPEYALLLGEMKLRAARLSVPLKKKMLIRAGIAALAATPDTVFLRAVRSFSSHKAAPADKAG